jgi:hypothetical protein
MENLKEKMFKVYESHSEGAHFVLEPDGENPDMLRIRSNEEEYWGKISFCISKEMARSFGEALIEMADFLDKHSI